MKTSLSEIYSNPLLATVRRITRRIGLNRQIERVMGSRGYENRFATAILSQVKADDCVWDIGANVGWYTTQFAEYIGSHGTVVAFEPVPSCFAALENIVGHIPTVYPVNLAIAETDGMVSMALATDALSATHRVVSSDKQSDTTGTCTVMARSAISVLDQHPEWFPNVVKIDVEGYEGFVVDGMQPILNDMRLRCLGIEIHFKLLEKAGEKDRPYKISQTLKQNSFDIRWTDPSHLIAYRAV